jgi:two-component system sensor histidine kinase HydH
VLSPNTDVGIDELRDLMRFVAESSHDLEQTHAALRNQVEGLQRELADANEQLQRSRALASLGQMAAGIAHEVRNPLASVRLYAQMLSDDLKDQPDQRGLCEKIDEAVVGLDNLVRDVLRFARDATITPVEVDAADLVEHALVTCAPMLDAVGVQVETQTPRSLRLEADPELLASALCNVVQNAVEALAGAGERRLRISVERDVLRNGRECPQAAVVFQVQDSGIGMKADVLKRIFDPFFTTRREGTGLGLAIVHRIIDAHNGHAVAWSEPGVGSRVRLSVPRHAQAKVWNQELER